MAAQGGEPPRDEIELLAFLAAPGVLEIEVAGKAERKEAPAGVTSFKVPLASGRPGFRLLRDGRAAVTLKSAFEIADKVAWQDLLYRGGSSSRLPVPGAR